jgi:hypothetical protein
MDESKHEAHGKVVRLVLPLKAAQCLLNFGAIRKAKISVE